LHQDELGDEQVYAIQTATVCLKRRHFMPVAGKKYPFIQSNVDRSPEEPGVYSLHDGGKVIYYGLATKSLRDRLQSHLRGDEGPCTKVATHYKREATESPAAREQDLLAAYKAIHGKLPRCNEVMP
jgi:hypothetical protein